MMPCSLTRAYLSIAQVLRRGGVGRALMSPSIGQG
jgi:hypothetical protein